MGRRFYRLRGLRLLHTVPFKRDHPTTALGFLSFLSLLVAISIPCFAATTPPKAGSLDADEVKAQVQPALHQWV